MIDGGIVFVTLDNGCYEKYLGMCPMPNLIVISPPGPSPATTYNEVFDKTDERFVCFIHSDVTYDGLLGAVERTIRARPGYLIGAVGVVGHEYVWSAKGGLADIETADSCCLVVDKEMGLRFDDKTFDGFHLYVEDICKQAGRVTTMDINAYDGLVMPEAIGDYFIHHSYTYRRQGAMWGEYKKYKERFLAKWPGAHTT